MGAKIKPKIDNSFNIDKLNPLSLEFYCLTDEIDKEVMERKGKTFNPDLAFKSLYFAITTDMRIGIIPNFMFEPWAEKNGVGPLEKSDKAKKCIEWFIKDIHKVKKIE